MPGSTGAWLDREIIRGIERQLAQTIRQPAFAGTAELLGSMPGVGPVTVTTLLALLPELGSRSAKSIAALAGLAPFNRDSGTFRGERHIGGGRRRVRRALFMAALSASRTEPRLKAVYLRIKERSGRPKIAIVAAARKLLVILNAMLKTRSPFRA